MKITFVATRKNFDHTERELYEMDLMLRVLGFRRSFLDLGIQTVAACTPSDIQIEIVDEYLQDIDYDMKTDLVALSAKTSCVSKAYDVAQRFRSRGKPVVLGGIHASLRPDEALRHVDTIVTGEAETLWPHVVRDFAAGKMKARYDAQGFPPMTAIPVPAWRAVDTSHYLFHQLQTTRGCPFRCKFCSVPDISGQDFRFKPIEQVVHEIRNLPRGRGPIAAGKPLYIVDDNFISRVKYTKDLLRALIPVYREGKMPAWSAETTLNVADDEEMLDLFRDAGCSTMIIGFESVSEATLRDMDKPVNFCLTYPEAVERIHARGITVVGNFIVGFDTDTRAVFKQTLDFIQQTGILYPFFSILTPMPGTGLFDDFKAAGRLDHERWDHFDTRHVVFAPRHMRRDELMDGYIWLYEQAYGTHLLLDRMERNWKQRPRSTSTLAEKLFVTGRLLPDMVRGDSELRTLYKDAFKLVMNRHLNSDSGHLLFLLDGYDFARFMRRYRSPRYLENYRTCANPKRAQDEIDRQAAASEKESLSVLQWQNKKAVLRTNKRALPVVQ